MIPLGIRSSGKYVDNLPFHVWVLLGDSELVEGSIWEAFDKAGDYKMSNVIATLDMNRLGQRGPTELGWDAPVYAARAFGWHAIEIDGHDIAAIDTAYKEALAQAEKPTCVVVKAVKGSGVSLVANKEGWHGTAPSAITKSKRPSRDWGASATSPFRSQSQHICSRQPHP